MTGTDMPDTTFAPVGPTFPLNVNTVTSEEGVTFTPWTDGWAIGYKVEAEGMPPRWLIFNPSGGNDMQDVMESNAFIYVEDTDPALPNAAPYNSICYIHIWDKEN